jgi:hypothetical protein
MEENNKKRFKRNKVYLELAIGASAWKIMINILES